MWGDIGRGQAQSRGEYLYSVWGGDTGRGLAQSTGEYLCSVGGGWVWGDRIIQPRGQYLFGVGANENSRYWAGTSTVYGVSSSVVVGVGWGGGGSFILCVVGIELLGV